MLRKEKREYCFLETLLIPFYYLEIFVDTQRFAGTCYRAANWLCLLCLGQTTGRGKKDKQHLVILSLKDVLGYPLVNPAAG